MKCRDDFPRSKQLGFVQAYEDACFPSNSVTKEVSFLILKDSIGYDIYLN
jgi:hypothetical protein